MALMAAVAPLATAVRATPGTAMEVVVEEHQRHLTVVQIDGILSFFPVELCVALNLAVRLSVKCP